MSDDITFCGSDCDNKKCFRHPSNIAEPSIPHSFSYFKGTEDCPYGVKKTMTPEEAVERVISLLQSCKGKDGCLGYIERYIYEEDEQAIDIAIQLLKEGEVYMTSKDFDLYLEGYKQGRKDFDRPKGEWKQGWSHINEIECSNCHWIVRKELRSDFCPKCGADMRGDKNERNKAD